MITIKPNILIDDIVLHKSVAADKMGKVLSALNSANSGKMIRTASRESKDANRLIALFTEMLSTLNMSTKDNIKELVGKITDSNLNKSAAINKTSMERSDEIKIASKTIKDSHYQFDISKDIIQREGRKMVMVSCYARDAYLGRYLIKRNYFYTEDRNKFADNAYDEILTKVGALKDRYYNEIIDVQGIFAQTKQILDGVVSEIEIKEDSIGTNYRR